MIKKSLKAFMRESVKNGEIVTAPGPDTIKDESGNIVMLEFRVMSIDEQEEIRKSYENRTIALDKSGKPIISDGQLVYTTDPDIYKASRHMIVESLVYPNLRDPELMKFYNCIDVTEMPNKVFTRKELDFVTKAFNTAHGFGETAEQKKDAELIAEAKN